MAKESTLFENEIMVDAAEELHKAFHTVLAEHQKMHGPNDPDYKIIVSTSVAALIEDLNKAWPGFLEVVYFVLSERSKE